MISNLLILWDDRRENNKEMSLFFIPVESSDYAISCYFCCFCLRSHGNSSYAKSHGLTCYCRRQMQPLWQPMWSSQPIRHKEHVMRYSTQSWIQDFPDWGGGYQPPWLGWGTTYYFDQFSPKTAWNSEKTGPRRDSRPSRTTLWICQWIL